jgi:hypothetical protein
MLSLLEVASIGLGCVLSFIFQCLKSRNKAQWSGTWSTVLCYLAGRIASPLEPTVSAAIFLSFRVGFSRVMAHVSNM